MVLNDKKEAVGVAYRRSRNGVVDPAEQVVSASKEVIISAGAVHSPQILMLSGIGPRKHVGLKTVSHC